MQHIYTAQHTCAAPTGAQAHCSASCQRQQLELPESIANRCIFLRHNGFMAEAILLRVADHDTILQVIPSQGCCGQAGRQQVSKTSQRGRSPL